MHGPLVSISLTHSWLGAKGLWSVSIAADHRDGILKTSAPAFPLINVDFAASSSKTPLTHPRTMAMDTTTTYFIPQSNADWEKWRPEFTRLYIKESLILPQVMKIMEDEHGVKAT
jgi:hypothetical protein